MSQLPLALGLTAAAAAYLLVCTLPGPLGHDPSQRRLQVSSVSLPAPPSSVTVSGSCIPNLNAIYELQAAAVNGRACYATADGLTMYWSSDGRFGAEWCLDADHDPAGVYAYIVSNARSPPDGTTVWQEYCDGAWGSNSLTLTPADVLASAPRSVTVSGSGSCDSAFDFFDATYTLQPVTLNGKPYYATVDETLFIYWSHVDWSGTPFASWSIDSDEDPAEVFAYIASDSDNPPGGTTVWQAYCNDVWGDTPLTLEAQLPAAAAGILALAPQSVTVTGSCAPEADAVYELQAATVNGKPCYVTSDGGLSVHWVPALERTGDTVASWVIESEADTGVGYLMSYVESTADSPPSGMMAWWQLCDGDWVSSTLTVVAAPSNQGGRRRGQAGAAGLISGLVHGTVARTDTIVLKRADMEARAAIAWQVMEQRTTEAPPTLDEMLIRDTAANSILQSLFTIQQEPHVTFPVVFRLSAEDSGGHRRLQKQGDHLKPTGA